MNPGTATDALIAALVATLGVCTFIAGAVRLTHGEPFIAAAEAVAAAGCMTVARMVIRR